MSDPVTSNGDKSLDAVKPTPRRRGWWRVVLISFAGLTAFWWGYMVLRPVVLPGPWYQDECTFGPITNAEYRDLLAQARVLAKRDRPKIREAVAERRRNAVGAVLGGQIAELEQGTEFVRDSIAVIHAVMRANGAHYTGQYSPAETQPYQFQAESYSSLPNSTSAWSVSFVYRFNLVWFGYYWPLRSNYPIGIDRYLYGSTRFAKTSGSDTTRVMSAVLFSNKHSGHVTIDRGASPCPPVPTQTWEDRYRAAMTHE